MDSVFRCFLSADNVQRIDSVFFFQCFGLLGEFDLEIRSGVIVFGFQGFFELGRNRLAGFGIFDEFIFLCCDRFPTFFIEFIFAGKLLEALDECFCSRDDAVNEFIFPAVFDGIKEGVYNDLI